MRAHPGRTSSALTVVALVATGCGGTRPQAAPRPETPSDAGASAASQPIPPGGLGPDGRILSECQSFPLVGLHYSPGGTVLPNKCAPFDATTNNPYAVRCIDAMPSFKTPFPGDEYCILPPPPDQGIQVGLHPQGKDYWAQMWAGDYSGYTFPSSDWVLVPGDEVTQNYRGSADNPDKHNYYRTYFRMRTGSHHNIITLNDNSNGMPDGWIALSSPTAEASPAISSSSGQGTLLGILGGQQRPDDSTPDTLDKPPEDSGYYMQWAAQPAVVFNMHHFNATSAALLREGWVNVWWESDATVPESWYMGLDSTEVKSMNIAPGSVVDLHYSWTIPDGNPLRLVRVFGHRHFWTTNFTAWLEPAGGGPLQILYQSFDWANMPTYRYDSLTKNPVPVGASHTDGAASGITMLSPGDKLHFNCHIQYTDERAMTNGSAPSPESNGNLHFANEAFRGEMCIQFGNTTGQLAFPTADKTPLPEFATQ